MKRLLLVGLLLLAGVASAQTPDAASQADASALQIAVAPFEAVGPGQRVAPDVARALSEALTARGVGRVLYPEQLALAEDAGVEEAVVAARRAGVGGVVTGRVTQLGSRLSVDVRLRSSASGGVLGTYVAEIPLGESFAPAAESLADRVVLGALNLVDTLEPGTAPAVPMVAPGTVRPGEASAGDAPGGPEAAAGREAVPPRLRRPSGKPPFTMGDLAGHPLSIQADELDATQRDDMRRLRFKQDVRVEQADLELTARELTADYPAGQKQPERLVARGDVVLRQGDREARCDQAVYERSADRIVCTGNAQLQDGDDEIEGEEITFDLAARGVVVEGGADLLLHPANSSMVRDGERVGDHPADAPMQVRADRLEAQEVARWTPDAGETLLNRIVLEGGVEVVQSGVTLRSDRLEVLYPEEAQYPERMEATGNVTLSQDDRLARCTRATYRASPHRIDCFGGDLDDAGDAVAGDVVSFDLDEDRVIVEGRARMRLAASEPEEDEAEQQ